VIGVRLLLATLVVWGSLRSQQIHGSAAALVKVIERLQLLLVQCMEDGFWEHLEV
jgi:hypothetical protein